MHVKKICTTEGNNEVKSSSGTNLWQFKMVRRFFHIGATREFRSKRKNSPEAAFSKRLFSIIWSAWRASRSGTLANSASSISVASLCWAWEPITKARRQNTTKIFILGCLQFLFSWLTGILARQCTPLDLLVIKKVLALCFYGPQLNLIKIFIKKKSINIGLFVFKNCSLLLSRLSRHDCLYIPVIDTSNLYSWNSTLRVFDFIHILAAKFSKLVSVCFTKIYVFLPIQNQHDKRFGILMDIPVWEPAFLLKKSVTNSRFRYVFHKYSF